MKFYKTVLLPIEVSDSDNCWDKDHICPHFDNEGGHPTCDLDLGNLIYNELGVKKPDKCLKLMECIGG